MFFHVFTKNLTSSKITRRCQVPIVMSYLKVINVKISGDSRANKKVLLEGHVVDGNDKDSIAQLDIKVATERRAVVVDQCMVYGWCGNMGICSYNDLMSLCGFSLENFEFADPGDLRKGCRRKVDIKDCPSIATMLQLDHT
ncbi:hypothetical protein Syun_001196 [Stephania yunnanensis]|uniref:Uncharacterized protein n=1 Tax=Stephania yunnanensis TaxID=152371 RepID=A0AAP0LDG8_9MAGN